jgi:hypothetical protein
LVKLKDKIFNIFLFYIYNGKQRRLRRRERRNFSNPRST